MSIIPLLWQHPSKFGRCSALPKQAFSFKCFNFTAVFLHPSHATSHHPPKMPVWGGMFSSWLSVWIERLASWDSFSGSRELLSRHCSLAGCTRGLGRHQTGNAQQVEAMAVYLTPFIRPKNQTEQQGPQHRHKAFPGWTHTSGRQPQKGPLIGHRWVRSGLVGTPLGGSPPPAGWLHSSFLTVPKEPG